MQFIVFLLVTVASCLGSSDVVAEAATSSSCFPAHTTQLVQNPGFENPELAPWIIHGNASLVSPGHMSATALSIYIQNSSLISRHHAYSCNVSQVVHSYGPPRRPYATFRFWYSITRGLPLEPTGPRGKNPKSGYICVLDVSLTDRLERSIVVYDNTQSNNTYPYRFEEDVEYVLEKPAGHLKFHMYCIHGSHHDPIPFTGVQLEIDDVTLTQYPSTCGFVLQISSDFAPIGGKYIQNFGFGQTALTSNKSEAMTFYIDPYENVNRVFEDAPNEAGWLNIYASAQALFNDSLHVVYGGPPLGYKTLWLNCSITPALQLECQVNATASTVFNNFYWCGPSNNTEGCVWQGEGLMIADQRGANCSCHPITLSVLYVS